MEKKSQEKNLLLENFPSRFKILKEELKRRFKVNLNQIAKNLDIKPQSWSRYEKGERLPNVRVMYQLVITFRVSPLWLLTGEGPMFLDEKEGRGKVVDFKDKRLKQMIEYLKEKWEEADLDGRRMIELEFVSAFRDYVDWLKKREEAEEKAE